MGWISSLLLFFRRGGSSGRVQAGTAIPMPLGISYGQSRSYLYPRPTILRACWITFPSDILQPYLTDSVLCLLPFIPKLCLLSYASDNTYHLGSLTSNLTLLLCPVCLSLFGLHHIYLGYYRSFLIYHSGINIRITPGPAINCLFFI